MGQEVDDQHKGCCTCCRPKFLLGLFFIVLIIVLWVGASELIQFVFDNADFSKPFFLTTYSSALFSLYLAGFLFDSSWREDWRASMKMLALQKRNGGRRPQDHEDEGGDAAEDHEILPLLDEDTFMEDGRKLPHEIAWLATKYTFPWLLGSYLFNLSLCNACGTGTTVASNTVLSSTCALWALLLSILFLGERGTPVKFISVATTITGAALVTGVDMDGESYVGDILALVSAITFGLISVLLKKWVPDDSSLNFTMFFGFLGVIHTLVCIPILLALHFAQWEILQPISMDVLGFLTVNALFGTVMSNVLWAKAIVLTTPLITNLGTSLSIPLSFLADYLNPNSHPPPLEWQYLLGSALILSSFVVVSLNPDDSSPPPLNSRQPSLPLSPNLRPDDFPGLPPALEQTAPAAISTRPPRRPLNLLVADPASASNPSSVFPGLYSPKPGILTPNLLSPAPPCNATSPPSSRPFSPPPSSGVVSPRLEASAPPRPPSPAEQR